MDYVGIDIGSTAAKVAVLGDHEIRFVLPTGWSSKETAVTIKNQLMQSGIDIDACRVAATGYGRNAVEYAERKITEITCHAAGAARFSKDCTIIDIGGQDTKVICVENGAVSDFLMNDKCSAGTGKFIEVMAARLGYDIDELFEHAALGKALAISSLCTVFAESEVINHIGGGCSRDDIAAGVIDSVAVKVSQMTCRMQMKAPVLLTGGLSHLQYLAKCLEERIGLPVTCMPEGRYAGAIGAAILMQN